MSSEWSDRIKNAEAVPPENGWEKIASYLDESFDGHSFPSVLHNLEATPPPGAWDKIQSSLDDESIPVIPIKKSSSIPSLLKYAAAACVIVLLAFGAIRYFNIGTDNIDVAAGPGIMPTKTDTPVSNSNSLPIPSQTGTAPDTGNIEVQEPAKDTYAKLDINSSNFSSGISRALYHSPVQLANTYTEEAFQKNPELQYPHRAAVNDFASENSSGRYLMFKNSQGQFVRISKKLTDLFCCVSGEEQDEDCNSQLKRWREKIASSSFIPSPDNFMDILDLVTSLQDNSRN